MPLKICWLVLPLASTNNTIVTNYPENAMFSGFCLYWVIRKEPPMFEQQYILNKIEQWVDRLPYQSLKIEADFGKDQTAAHWISSPPPTEGR